MKFRLLSLLALTACAVGPDYQRPDIALPQAYVSGVEIAENRAPWWQGFADPELDRLMDEALSDNLDIAAAEARLARAQAFIAAERSDLLPTVDGGLDAQATSGNVPDAAAGLFGVFTPDLFGARRRELAAAKANAQSAEAALFDARRATAAALASSYVELRRTDARIALLQQSLDLQQQTLRIVRLRAEAGLAADLDVQRAVGDLAQTRAQQGPLAASRADAVYTISILKGDAPGTETVDADPEADIPHFQSGPGLGVPAELLRTRPDIRAAEQDLIAATNLVGAELADLLPSLNLTGAITTQIDAGSFADDTVRRASAVLDIPLVDLGRRRAEVRAARASRDEALASYRLALLSALGDVESALVGIEAARARRDDLEEAVSASTVAFDQLQALYTEGLASLIDVLDAQRQLIASRERYTDSDAALAQAYVRLYTALGDSTPPA